MKTLRKYHTLFLTLLLFGLSALLAYIPMLDARRASWINPEYDPNSEIPIKTDPWLEEQKKLEKEREIQEKFRGKNI